MPKHGASIINVESIVSLKTREPLVLLKWGAEEGKLSPIEARKHALSIMQAAEGAEIDSFLYTFFIDKCEVEPEKVAQLVVEFRNWRARRAEMEV